MKNTKTLNVSVSNRDALLDVTLTLTRKWTHTPKEVTELAELAEKRLDRMCMPMGKRKGITATHTSKGLAARAYGHAVNGSVINPASRGGWLACDRLRGCDGLSAAGREAPAADLARARGCGRRGNARGLRHRREAAGRGGGLNVAALMVSFRSLPQFHRWISGAMW